MQGSNTQNENVVSLFAARNKAKESSEEVKAEEKKEESFSDVMAKNMKNKERMEKERLNANKSVLRSYRIKH
jgi:hypothetical protein